MPLLDVTCRRMVLAARGVPSHATRLAWFRTKRRIGIPTRSDRPFLVNELVQCLDKGLIGSALCITSAGRTDGAGAQAMSKMSAMALAKAYGLTYVHTPFESMEHANGMSPAAWAALWEGIFNLGHGELQASACRLPHVAIEDFISDHDGWGRPSLLTTGHFVRFTDLHPEAYLGIADALRAKYRAGLVARPTDGRREVVVCAHVRRGDVSAADAHTAHRAANVQSFLTCLRQVTQALQGAGVHPRIKIFSQGDVGELDILRDLDCELLLDTSAIATFHALVDADVLLMGRSSFSFSAALLRSGLTIYDRFARTPVPGWLVRSNDGSIAPDALASGIHSLIQRGPQASQFMPKAQPA